MYQWGDKNIRVLLPFIGFIYGKLAAWNSVEPITLFPGIFKSSVCNLSKSWPISGLIEDSHNFLAKVETPQVTLSQIEKKNKKKWQFRNPKKPMVNMIHINLTYYHGIIRYILDDLV